MANGSRGSRSNDAGNLKEESGSGSGKVLSTAEASGLRRSGRETAASKSKVVTSPPTTKKTSSSVLSNQTTSSGSNNKKIPTTPPGALGTRRSERLRTPEANLEERKFTSAAQGGRSSSPTRRSERVKSMSSPSPVGAKKMELTPSSLKRKKERKEMSVNQLNEVTKEDTDDNDQDAEPARVVKKKKTMNARAFKALLKPQTKKKLLLEDQDQVLNASDKLSKEDDNPCTTNGSYRVDQTLKCSEREGGPECSKENGRGLPKQCDGVVDNPSPNIETSTKTLPESPKCMKDACETEVREETQDTRSGHRSEEESSCGIVNLVQNLADSPCQKERWELEAGKASADTAECGNHKEAQELPLEVHGGDDCSTCFSCKLGGDLLRCEGNGCERSYHLHCLDPPLIEFPYGTWYCITCVKKKIKFGVHSTSKGVESILDAREIEIMGNKEKQKQKQYYVKHKGLAHVHNRWMTETELLHESPSLVAAFIDMSPSIRWKPEWSMPQRLLQKRRLLYPKQLDDYCERKNENFLDFQYEWLVKWCGLDYDQVTWELENSQFLNTPEAQRLKIAYENRCKAKSDNTGVKNKGPFVKLSQLPLAVPLESASSCLDSVNKLREFWFKGQNAILVAESERMLKVIQFTVDLESSISRPILIIASSDELPKWEREFLHLAPSINVVIYSGNIDVRRCIRRLENFDEQYEMTFQVLITTGEVLTEDLDVLLRFGWEMIIIDECQRSNAWMHFGHLKGVTTEMRVLLVSGKLEETVAEYCNLLSLLHCRGGSIDKDFMTGSSHDIVSLRNKISRYMVHDKLDTIQFVEYWVPAQASNVQLEHYCATLFSNSLPLCSSSKKDPVEALCDMVIRNRKCCDHPYIVDPSVQGKLLQGLPPSESEYLAIGIKASGKLQLLDSMLSEIKKRGLRVLILVQSLVGIGKDPISIGDILDDYMRQRFGSESYERIDVLHSKKQAALDKFNNKESGRFVLLLEARACSPSIKLASIDAVIIYGSDWIPTHDFKNLQKISFRSQFDQIKVFRLYSTCTLEERVLIHVKQNMALDSPQNKFRNTNHKLLMWGASYLFKRLEDFHSGTVQGIDTSITSQDAHLLGVLKEFSAILDGSSSSGNCSIISTVKHSGTRYKSDNLLVGESKIGLSDEVLPHMYWTHLLNGKNPQWKYVSDSSQRNRKRANHMDDPAKKLDVEIAEVSKKRKKVVKDQGYVKFQQNNAKTLSGNKEGRENLHDMQESLQRTLQSEVLKLCRALQLADDVEGMVRKFLAYVMTNHPIPDKSTTIIQAFQIALCWTAASLLKQKIDHKASIAHAKELLSYKCTEEDAERVYSKLRCLKSMFLFHSGVLKAADYSTSGTKDGSEIAEMVEKDVLRSLKKIEKKSNKHMSKLLRKQEEERKELLAICEEDSAQLEKSQKLDTAVIRVSNDNVALREDKLKRLDVEYKKKFKEIEKQRELRLRCLDEIQLAARKKEEERVSTWVEEVNSWAHLEILDKLSPESFHKLASASCDTANKTRSDMIECVEDVNEHPTIPETDARGHVVSQDSTRTSDIRPSVLSGNLDRRILMGVNTNNIEQCHGQDSAAFRSKNGPENFRDADTPSHELNTGKTSMSPIGQASSDVILKLSTLCQPEDNVVSEIPHLVKTCGDSGVPLVSSSTDNLVDVLVNRPSSEVDNPPGASPNMADRQYPSGQPTTVGAGDCLDGVTSVSLPQTVASGGHGEHIHPSATLSTPDVLIPSQMPEVSSDAVTCNPSVDQVQTCSLGAATPNSTIVSQHDRANCTNIQDSCDQAPEVESSVPPISKRFSSENVQSLDLQAESHPSDSGESGGDNVITAAKLTTTLPSTSDNAIINDSPSQEPIAEPVEPVQMRMSTSFPACVIGSQQSTGEVPALGSLTSTSASQPQQSNEIRRPPQIVQAPLQLPENIMSHLSHNTTLEPARTPFPIYSGPLQSELERIRKEIDDNNKLQQEKKLQLDSECEKEIAEVVAQIRQKYNVMYQGIDAEYGAKSKELEKNYDKVLMNKILAEAFMSKCMDVRPPSAPGLGQDRNSNFRQQMALHLSSQQTSQGHSSAITSSTGHPTSSSQITAGLHLQHIIPPAVSPMTPTVQGICHSLAPLQSILPRPAEVTHLCPPTSTQVGVVIRAMAPALQHNRSSMPMTTIRTPFHSHANQLPPVNINSPSSLPVFVQLPSQKQTQASPSVPYSRQQRPDFAGGLPDIPNSSPLMVPTRISPVVNSSNMLPEFVHMGSDHAVQSKIITHDRMQNTSACTAGADIVCLSDDD